MRGGGELRGRWLGVGDKGWVYRVVRGVGGQGGKLGSEVAGL